VPGGVGGDERGVVPDTEDVPEQVAKIRPASDGGDHRLVAGLRGWVPAPQFEADLLQQPLECLQRKGHASESRRIAVGRVQPACDLVEDVADLAELPVGLLVQFRNRPRLRPARRQGRPQSSRPDVTRDADLALACQLSEPLSLGRRESDDEEHLAELVVVAAEGLLFTRRTQ